MVEKCSLLNLENEKMLKNNQDLKHQLEIEAERYQILHDDQEKIIQNAQTEVRSLNERFETSEADKEALTVLANVS